LWRDDAVITNDLTLLSQLVVTNSEHSHKLAPGSKTGVAGAIASVTPSINLTIQPTGLTPKIARTTGAELAYVNKLTVLYDGVQDITAQILTQLNGTDPTNWPLTATLGDGTSGHPLVVNGTGRINLMTLGLD